MRAGVRTGLVAIVMALVLVMPPVMAQAAARPPGTAAPPAGTGMGTAAAFANPHCNKSGGPYGKLEFVVKQGFPDPGGSPICVAVWKGKDNGGATYEGVTKDTVKVVALLPNDQQTAALPPTGRAIDNSVGTTGSGTMHDALEDGLAVYQAFFETYGRKVEFDFVTSTGNDETAQRTDAVTVTAAKPFAVIDATWASHDTFEQAIAAAKIPVMGLGNTATYQSAQQQAPYRWGQADAMSSAVNTAEFLGKQLAGKKAAYAGDASIQSQTRKFGVVYPTGAFDPSLFNKALAKYHATISPSSTITYPLPSGVLGDPAQAQELAPTAITKLKGTGVTSVVLLADQGMINALLKKATDQDYHPEWILTSYNYNDLALFARNYDQDQWKHAFGISSLPVGFGAAGVAVSDPSINDPVQWYFGKGKGTTSVPTYSVVLTWLMEGIMYAGPKLTPATFEQGLFAAPAQGGAADDSPFSVLVGYGRTPGLPYDEYLRGTQDFTMVWWDPDTLGAPATPGGTPQPGVYWYLDSGKRYSAGHWPTKPLKFFDKSTAKSTVPGMPVLEPVPCDGCPSQTGQGEPPSRA
jgi:hypothetical protein